MIAAALSLGLTAGLMVLLKSPHPPAGATTLIISLSILTKPEQLLLLMVAVVLFTVQAFVINRQAILNDIDCLVNFEFQSYTDSTMPKRMLEYNALATFSYNFPTYSFVIYL